MPPLWSPRRKTFFFTAARLDQMGMIASILCALHCLLVPLLVGLVPLVGLSRLADETTEWYLVGIAFVFGMLSLLPSYWWDHGRKQPLRLFAMGVGLILVARLCCEDFKWIETVGVVSGSVVLATAHALNLRCCHACRSLAQET